MWKNIVERGRPQATISDGAEKIWFACRITNASINTFIIFNIYSFSTTKMVTRTRLNECHVTLTSVSYFRASLDTSLKDSD